MGEEVLPFLISDFISLRYYFSAMLSPIFRAGLPLTEDAVVFLAAVFLRLGLLSSRSKILISGSSYFLASSSSEEYKNTTGNSSSRMPSSTFLDLAGFFFFLVLEEVEDGGGGGAALPAKNLCVGNWEERRGGGH